MSLKSPPKTMLTCLLILISFILFNCTKKKNENRSSSEDTLTSKPDEAASDSDIGDTTKHLLPGEGTTITTDVATVKIEPNTFDSELIVSIKPIRTLDNNYLNAVLIGTPFKLEIYDASGKGHLNAEDYNSPIEVGLFVEAVNNIDDLFILIDRQTESNEEEYFYISITEDMISTVDGNTIITFESTESNVQISVAQTTDGQPPSGYTASPTEKKPVDNNETGGETPPSDSPPTLFDAPARIYVTSVPITPLTFANTGSPAVSCSSSPPLPAGLIVGVNTNTCEITGTPSATVTATIYTITATASDSSEDTATVNITVNDPPPPPTSFGYTQRACGFDMNRDGTIGAEEDCYVCDGLTTDPDGDSTDEDLLYVDSVTGDDSTGDGTSGNPYKTIQKALDMADGPGDSAEDIICIAGTFNESIIPKQNGIAGIYNRDNFDFPNNPLMIVGWDKDNDGEYPPYDADDTAVIDGQNALGTIINYTSSDVSYVEVAHFTVQNFTNGHSFNMDSGSGNTHLYLHDIEGSGLNSGMTASSVSSIVYNSNASDHIAFINISLTDVCCSLLWGHAPNSRYQYNSVTFNGSDRVNGFYVFEYDAENIEILNNDMDGNPAAWTPTATTYGVRLQYNAQSITIRGNRFKNFVRGFRNFNDSGCTRPSTNIIFDQNYIELTYNAGIYSGVSKGISIQAGAVSNYCYIESMSMTNNILVARGSGTFSRCFDIYGGNNQGVSPGSLTIVGNSCYANNGGEGLTLHPTATYPQHNITVKNNIFNSIVNQNIDTNYVPTNWQADGNIYDSAATYVWNSVTQNTIADWRNASSNDTNAKECSPNFIDAANGDLHLQSGDTCAKDAGVDVTSITTVDYDGDARSNSSPDAGADEL